MTSNPNKANKCCKNYYGYKLHKEMHEHYESLFNTSVKELKFYRLCVEQLYNVIDEIETLTNDNLVKGLIKNGKERHNLDKLCHTRSIFWNGK